MQFTVDQQVLATVTGFLDAHGNPATVDGIPTWETDRADLVELTPSADGMSCLIKPLGLVGAPVITQTADADLGEGIKSIVTMGVLDLTGGEAVASTMTFAAAP